MTRVRIRAIALALTGALIVAGAAATTQDSAMDHPHHAAPADHHDHAAAVKEPSPFHRSQHVYTLPEVMLRDQAGTAVPVSELQGASGPLAVNFIFATCTTICPVMTATFAQMRRELGIEADRIRLVSITIDPEHDTPAVLAEYAARFDASPGWSFLTGNPEDIERVLRAFDAWTGSKTNHRPITLMRGRGEVEWVRLEGLGSGAALADLARAVLD